MVRRRFLLAGGLLVGLGVIGLFVWWRSAPAQCITWANFDRIQGGMTRADIAALLGGPPGDYLGDAVHYGSLRALYGHRWGPPEPDVWAGPRLTIVVGYNVHGGARLKVAESSPQTPWPNRLRRWLRL